VPGWTGKKADAPPLTIGQAREFKVIRVSETERKISLSVKALADDAERKRLDTYQRRAEAVTSSLGDILPRSTAAVKD
jgi:small subunit ribosomal protein S1